MTLSPKQRTNLIICSALVVLLGIVVFQSSEEVNSDTKNPILSKVSPTIGRSTKRGSGDLASLLEQTIQPLKQAAFDHNEDLDLPTEKEVAAAVDSNRLDSPESLIVLDRLEKGYERYNMPFPSLRKPEFENQTNGLTSKYAGLEIKSWLEPTIERLRTKIGDGKEALRSIPSDAEQKAAIKSEAWDSQETKLVLDTLRKSFFYFKIKFPEPREIKQFSEENALDKDTDLGEKLSSNQRRLQAYFKGQIQRLRLESNAQSKDISTKIPSDVEVLAAIKTEGLKSDASILVVEKLKSCYEDLGLTFYEPPMQD
jgi:hypothetical protein